MNPFESGARKNIPAVLIYARNQAKILMIHRNLAGGSKPQDFHSGKWNGLGGKSEIDESAVETAAREFKEESGLALHVDRFQPCGVLQFPNFKPLKSEDWTVFVFTADLTSDEASGIGSNSDEGSLHWIPERDLLGLNLWPGDRYFIPHVIDRKSFFGTIWYRASEVLRHDVRPLGIA